ncbi:membrane-associated phospholipid phosphatase [Algoriphagus sp. 4150]|uniref:phosphatase PAP2 family protein n=1 Tax=Algoriphagus sp. 4150 TaxID=2817756 RepID=UPI0028568A91|nr:phosphatase PAP2 family protein [Algoriphagus sp. 4150]MDR7130377.1 membrane-associated phospholipid phosphatase [Algoriphagus sp. 4150]
MKKKKYSAPVFAFLYFQILIILLVLLLRAEKGSLELWINNYHTTPFDFFFKNITYLGDGIIVLAPTVILLFVRYSYSILLAWATLIHMVIVVLCKRILFSGMPRPAEYLADIPFYTVPGVSVHHWNSFPSGHTASAFMLACVLAMIFSKKIWPQIILLLIAVLIGFSRVYLMQHFFMDVLAGSLVGVWSAFAARVITLSFFSSKKYKRSLYPKRKVILQDLGQTRASEYNSDPALSAVKR